MEDIQLENFQWQAPKKLRPRWMPSITAEINPRQIIWTSFEAEAPKPTDHPVPAAAATMPLPIPPDNSYVRMNSLDSIEPPVLPAVLLCVAAVPAAAAVICEETASTSRTSTTGTCNASIGSGSTDYDYYQTTPDECLEVQPTPILKITGGKYKGKMCTVVRPTAKMVVIQILGDTRTRRIMKTSLLWDKVDGPFKPCP